METPKTKAAIAIQRGTRSWTERGKAAAAKKQVEAQAAAQALLKAQFAKPAPSSSLRKASSRKAVVAPPEEAATAKAGSSGTSRARRSGSSKSVVGSKSVVAFVAAPVDDAPAPPPPAKANQSALARARTASGAVYSSLPRAEAPSSQGGPFNSPPAPSATIGRAQSAASLLPARSSSSSSSMNMSSTVRAPTAETETRGGMEAMLSRGGAASGGYTGPKFDDALGVVHDTPAQGDEEASQRAEAWLKTEQTRQVSFHMKHGEVGYDAESSKRKASASASSSVKKNPFNFGPGANAKTNNNPRRRAPRSKTEQVLLEAEAAQNFAVMEEKKPRSKTFQAIDIIMCRSCPTGSSLIPVGPWV